VPEVSGKPRLASRKIAGPVDPEWSAAQVNIAVGTVSTIDLPPALVNDDEIEPCPAWPRLSVPSTSTSRGRFQRAC